MRPSAPILITARRVRMELAAFRDACRLDGAGTTERQNEANAALAQASGLTFFGQFCLIADCANEELAAVPARYRQQHSEQMDDFIDRPRALGLPVVVSSFVWPLAGCA